MRLEGTWWNWVTGFKLLYSDLGRDWQGYSSNEDFDKVAYTFGKLFCPCTDFIRRVFWILENLEKSRNYT